MNFDTVTDRELIDELSGRHGNIIVIRPDIKDDKDVLIFCKTENEIDVPYTLVDATKMLQDAQIGLITDCFEGLTK